MTLLRESIIDKELSQHRLARWTGLSQGRISLISRGITKPHSKEKEVLEQSFGLPIKVLLEQGEDHEILAIQ